MTTLLVVLLAVLALYALFVAALAVSGRRAQARAWAGFVPDCAVLVTRLLRDERVPRRHRALLLVLAAYLASPIDLVPDMIPVAGQLDDAIVLGLILGYVLRGAGRELLDEHWPGPPSSRELVARLCRL